jgi:hypothetical protein
MEATDEASYGIRGQYFAFPATFTLLPKRQIGRRIGVGLVAQ